jgi:hypothetical protein
MHCENRTPLLHPLWLRKPSGGHAPNAMLSEETLIASQIKRVDNTLAYASDLRQNEPNTHRMAGPANWTSVHLKRFLGGLHEAATQVGQALLWLCDSCLWAPLIAVGTPPDVIGTLGWSHQPSWHYPFRNHHYAWACGTTQVDELIHAFDSDEYVIVHQPLHGGSSCLIVKQKVLPAAPRHETLCVI